VSSELDAWLFRRAAAGDEAAFERLIERHIRKLRSVCATYLGSEAAADDLLQLVLAKLWDEARCGRYNPHRAPFSRYASTVAYQALNEDRQRRRAQKRWAAEPPVSLDVARDFDLDPFVAPSWWHGGVDPLVVVLERERLRLAWQELSEANQAVLNRWLAADGGNRPDLTHSESVGASRARARGRAVLGELA
jgi:RNA polymerase sigma factor (sigma-70 family)